MLICDRSCLRLAESSFMNLNFQHELHSRPWCRIPCAATSVSRSANQITCKSERRFVKDLRVLIVLSVRG